MLTYFKKYRTLSYAISFGVPILIIVIAFFAGVNLMAGIYGGITFLVCMLVLMFVTSKYFGARAERETEEAIAQYNEKCDPEAFREQGREIATAIYEDCYAKGTTELGAWFLSPYALAVADTDGNKDAEMMEQMMLEHIPADTPNLQRAGILINIEPLTLRLHGPEAALALAREAQDLLISDVSPEAMGKKGFLSFEVPLLEALTAGDIDKLQSLFESVCASDRNPLRIRVLDSDALGGIYAARGEMDKAEAAYQFVIDQGNKLPVVQEARVKLAAL